MAWKPDYVLPDVLGEYVRITDDLDDVWLAWAATAASRAIDRHCRRQFGKVAAPEARRYRVRKDAERCAWVADIDDLMTATGLLIAGVAAVAPDFSPLNAEAEGRPWESLVIPDDVVAALTAPFVTLTASWGWSAVPATVAQMAGLQGGRLISRRNALFGVAGSPDAGSEVRLLAKLDPDVAVLASTYRRKVRPR